MSVKEAEPLRRSSVYNIPNLLTTSRFFLAIILFILIEQDAWAAATSIFALAAFTDWLDGYIARLQGITSTLGRNLDPLVDKVLICGAYIYLLPVEGSMLTTWMVTIVVARELIITGLRGFLETHGAVFGADWLGKVKMVLQCAALIAIFLTLWFKQEWMVWPQAFLIYAMLAATAASGLQYLWKAASMIKID